ncbi:GNAT family N-acetyltransferase [Actinacidiphila bryophytorum]|uniref:GNAT family N-acetyltransferase n=1 Tax=Actinacidiphila bryophytorum TaxID=1436133 RepID=A0A9W4GZ35_9ACTN|nr:GNAT family N-acetyltransferase [Actinacidiphila bryophytorum]MBM9439158.1 GNAT family N-acetyltransferase [Actinacidiphila bryophytorum]MBN6547092.1 GNAT family N-acetyltransferase [Actinacidiphila bryophytorum]CAG7621665.1 GNAT family N-acetyltransferase [Actinacidiphila bryophytorum]
MAAKWRGDTVRFRRATADSTATVLDVLDEAAQWLAAQGVSQWPPRFEAAWVEGAISRGETWLVEVAGEAAGTVTLDRSDPLWADSPGPAAYVHRMAVRRRAAGLGAVILAWAADTARTQAADALRLDCVASNTRLRAYYESHAFMHRGDAPVGGAPGQRTDHGPVTWVSRYELPLNAPAAAN